MRLLPKFHLYGENNPDIEKDIQPELKLRKWTDLSVNEKKIAFQELVNRGWIRVDSKILDAVEHLNENFLRECPGKNLHNIPPSRNIRSIGNEHERIDAALEDFHEIFVNGKSEAMIFRMLTVFAKDHIDRYAYGQATREVDAVKRNEHLEMAFREFDKLASCLNHIFKQFCIDATITRGGLVPQQDARIVEQIYKPTLLILSDPKWKTVSDDLAQMFADYQEQNYPEVITKGHRIVQRFLQILVGEEGKNAKGELADLFKKAKEVNIIPVNQFTEPIIRVFQGFISSERATNSTAKPTTKVTTPSDALLVMNVVMVFLQHCLQK